jgi:hypothetical protein
MAITSQMWEQIRANFKHYAAAKLNEDEAKISYHVEQIVNIGGRGPYQYEGNVFVAYSTETSQGIFWNFRQIN